jgi:Tol biopolymer transport system component
VPKFHFYRYIVFALILSSCSIEINQTTEIPPTPSIESTPTTSSTSSFPTTHTPVTWANLNLTGKLIYLNSSMENNSLIARIQMLDLTTGDIATIFGAPPGGWVYYMTVSPDTKNMVMSYIPPSQGNSLSSRALYIIPFDATAILQPLFQPPSPHDHYVQAEWSPDGKYIYYAHYNDNDKPDDQLNPPYDLFRMSYPDGQPEKIADLAFWPRVSSDSTKLAYVSLQPTSGLNELFIANVDGSNPQKVSFSGSWIPDIIDAPIFSPDGQSILFSAPGPSQSYEPNWFEKAMGIQVAKAHSVPSDWWSVPVTGGTPTQLTKLQTINLFASFSPDKKYIASMSGDGLFVMDLDGSNLTRLLSDSGVHGTVSWIP